MAMAQERLNTIVQRHGARALALIAVLQKTEKEFGYLSQENLRSISTSLRVPLSRVFGVITFYSQFHLKPRGKHVIRLCLDTACHVRGGEQLFNVLSRKRNVGAGETTPDMLFTLERVACPGACGLAPAVMVNEKTYGHLAPGKVERLVNDLKKQAGA
ncbi:MAG: NAD(P)H-dependent oxidoreductase subunit E [Bacillota bacterium]